ncbi:Hsp20/alpha crystallin family protein [Candidatus Poribacteria bacterium]|nr:Hsp20/alpha crystallin family protein [Candidatus Poribacteria bacterium]
MPRSIPPKTMSNVRRQARSRDRSRSRPGGGLYLKLGGCGSQVSRHRPPTETKFSASVFRKPRSWRFQIKPLFKRIRGLGIDVFHEAEEVLIVIDLGGFRRGDVSLSMTPEKYSVYARQGDEEFREEIVLPPDVDVERSVENLRNGVLEILLPRKKGDTQEVKSHEDLPARKKPDNTNRRR